MKKNSKQPTKAEKISDVTPYGDFFATYFQNKSEDEKIKILNTLGALTFVLARGFNLYNSMFKAAAKQLRFEHTQERKMYLKMIEDGCDKCRVGLTNFEDWALQAQDDANGLDYYLQDGAWAAQLIALSYNASDYNDNARLFIESWCKSQTKGDPSIPYEIINALKPEL